MQNFLEGKIHRTQNENRGVGVSGSVQGTAGYRGDCWTVIGGIDRVFYYCIQTENFENFRKRVVSECILRMLSGWGAATRHLPGKLAHAHLLHS
jgi:hypothetical protein